MLRAKARVGLGGRMSFVVMDADGNVERGRGGVPIFRDPSGFVRRCGVDVPNLITDAGFREAPTDLFFDPDTNSGRTRRTMRLGSGSGVPAPSDVALGAQFASTSGDGGFAAPAFVFDESDPNTLVIEQGTYRYYTNGSGSGVVASEYGFDPGGGDLRIRSLFRDGNGDPASITIPDGKSLRALHTLRGEFPKETAVTLTVNELDAGGAQVGSVDYAAKLVPWLRPTSESSSANTLVGRAWTLYRPTKSMSYGYPVGDANTNADTAGVSSAWDAGTLTREWAGTFGASKTADVDAYAMGDFVTGSLVFGAWLVVLDPAGPNAPIQQDDLHTLTVRIALTYGRL